MFLVKQPITSDIKTRADELVASIERSGVFEKPNYTGINETDRYWKGYVGELTFCDWLASRSTKFKYDPQTDGYSDDGDVILFFNGAPIRFDIKSSFWNSSVATLITVQWLTRNPDAYVFGVVDRGRTEIEFRGWSFHSETEHWRSATPFKYPSLVCPWNELRDLSEIGMFDADAD